MKRQKENAQAALLPTCHNDSIVEEGRGKRKKEGYHEDAKLKAA